MLARIIHEPWRAPEWSSWYSPSTSARALSEPTRSAQLIGSGNLSSSVGTSEAKVAGNVVNSTVRTGEDKKNQIHAPRVSCIVKVLDAYCLSVRMLSGQRRGGTDDVQFRAGAARGMLAFMAHDIIEAVWWRVAGKWRRQIASGPKYPGR